MSRRTRYLGSSVTVDRLALDISAQGLCDELTARSVILKARDLMVQALTRGERVHVRGLGTFRVSERAAVQAVTPKGGHVDLPRRGAVAYRPAKFLRHLPVVPPAAADEAAFL